MTTEKFAQLSETCLMLARKGRDVFRWSWDDYTDAMLSAYTATFSDEVLSWLADGFPERFTSETIGDAPAPARKIADAWGGLRSGQQLMLSHLDGLPLIAAALWPWGDGKTISLRLRLFNEPLTDELKSDRQDSFRQIFESVN